MFSKVFFAVILVIAMFASISEAYRGGGGFGGRGFGGRGYGGRGYGGRGYGYRGGYGGGFGYGDAFYDGFGFGLGAAYVLPVPVVTTAVVLG